MSSQSTTPAPPPPQKKVPSAPPTPPEPEYVPVDDGATAPIQPAFGPEEIEAAKLALSSMTPEEFLLLKKENEELKTMFPEAGGVAFTRMFTPEGAEISITAKSTNPTAAGVQLQKALQNLAEICNWTLVRGASTPATSGATYWPTTTQASTAGTHLRVIGVSHAEYKNVDSLKVRFLEEDLRAIGNVPDYMIKYGVPAYGNVIPSNVDWKGWPLDEVYAVPELAFADVVPAKTSQGKPSFKVSRFSAT